MNDEKDYREDQQQMDGSTCKVKGRPYDQPSHQEANEQEQKNKIR